MIKVILADDHALLRHGISAMLAGVEDIALIGQANTGEEAVKLALVDKPDVVLMDVRMNGIGGLEASRRILKQQPASRIIGLSGYPDMTYPRLFLNAGAAGYILKGAPAAELVTAIRTVYAGKTYVSPELEPQLLNTNNHHQNPFDDLSERERQVCLLRAEGCPIEQIADQLDVSLRSANNYRYRAFEKLNIKSDVELIKLALRFGMILLEETSAAPATEAL